MGYYWDKRRANRTCAGLTALALGRRAKRYCSLAADRPGVHELIADVSVQPQQPVCDKVKEDSADNQFTIHSVGSWPPPKKAGDCAAALRRLWSVFGGGRARRYRNRWLIPPRSRRVRRNHDD